MDEKSLQWSIPVPSVQELVRNAETIDAIPPRYVWDEVDLDGAAEADAEAVPCIDMAKLLTNGGDYELRKLHRACKNWGIFHVKNHRIAIELIEQLKGSMAEFFDLPLTEKKRWSQRPGRLEGYGQAFVTSEDQKLEWCDMIFLKALPEDARNLDLWPPILRGALEKYSESTRELAVTLVKFIAAGLGIEEDEHYSEAFRQGNFDVRMNCYPICPQPERVMGIAAHADMSGITMLMECGDVAGLQVLKDGNWVFVPPIDGAITVNLGQIMEIISNGNYKAPDHRAVANRYKDRLDRYNDYRSLHSATRTRRSKLDLPKSSQNHQELLRYTEPLLSPSTSDTSTTEISMLRSSTP